MLYPYVYLTTRAMFISQPAHLLEAARTLGCSATGTFFRVALPMARPALAVGISLALLETLNDIGASEFLGVQTLTVTVYTTWISRSDLSAAAQIACMMLMFIFLILTLEFYGRRKQGFSSRSLREIQPTRVRGWRGWLLGGVISLPVVLGFLAPVLFLMWESAKRIGDENPLSSSLLSALQNTLSLAAGTTLVVVCVSMLVAWSARHSAADNAMPGFRRGVMRLASLGYAVPGTILAIGFYPRHGCRPLAGRFTGCSRPAADVRRDPAGNLLCHAIPGDCHWRAGFWSGPHSTFAGTGVSSVG